jgi:hypothetical protein
MMYTSVSGMTTCDLYDDAYDRERRVNEMVARMLDKPHQPKGKGMFNEMVNDARGFVKENKAVIYWVAILFLADHFFFNGRFRDKLHALVERAIGKCEKAIEKV